MKILSQLTVIFGIMLLSQFLCSALSLPIPANILGMMILLVLLATKLIKPEQIKEVSSFLYKNMAFFIIPATLGIMADYKMLQGKALAFISIVVISAAFVFGSTGITVEVLQKALCKRRGGKP